VREIDPDRKTIVRSLNGPGPVDVLLYDSTSGRLYAGAGHAPLEAIDARTFTVAGTVALPGDALTQLAADPITRDLYATFSDRSEVAIVDTQRDAVRATFPTGLAGAADLRFDSALGEIVVVDASGALDVYDRAGTPLGGVSVPAGIVACDLDGGDHVLACADPAGLTFVQLQRAAAPVVIGATPLDGPVLAAFDAGTHDAVAVRSLADGSRAQVQVFGRMAP
jgi:DNA-binding beta-propeller fold protein YncE